jgi:uncharacterized protein YjdB
MSTNRSSARAVSSSFVVAMVAALAGVAGCSSGGGGTTPATLTAIQVTPATPSIPVGITQQLAATGAYSDGTTRDLTGQVTWASGAAATATVSTGGLVNAVQVGGTSISATSSGVTGSASVKVTSATLQRVDVSPSAVTIPAGTHQQFTAMGHFSNGTAQDVTQQATWASNATGTATVSATGLATGVVAGSATISATLTGVTGSASLSVSGSTLRSIALSPASPQVPVGFSVALAATGTFSDGTTQDLTSHSAWTTASAAIATVNVGVVTGVSKGTATITATYAGVSGTTPVLVDASLIQSITVSPVDLSIPAGATQQYAATGSFSDGDSHDVTDQASWTTSPTGIATVSATGLAKGVAAGTTRVTATLGGVSGGTNLTVGTAPVIPTPLPDRTDYFQVLIDNRVTASEPVHLAVTANQLYLNAPAILNITWLTGGGPNFDDWANPVFHIVDSPTGSVADNCNFSQTYDVTLDKLPLDPSGQYRVLLVPYLDPANPSRSLGGSGHFTFTIGSAPTIAINANAAGAPLPYSFALPSPSPTGTDGQLRWDFVEFNCATPAAANGKPVCVIDTTNVDFFSLGFTAQARQPDETYASFGLELVSAQPVAGILSVLNALSSDYTAGYTEASDGTFLRYLAPDYSFTSTTVGFQAGIDAAWASFETTPLQFSITSIPYQATTIGGVLTFTQPESFTIAKPTALEAVAATGPMSMDGQTVNAQNGIKFVGAYLNRGVAGNPALWGVPAQYYPAGGYWNAYAQALHARFIGGLCYGFSFDDVPSGIPTASAVQQATSASLVINDQ